MKIGLNDRLNKEWCLEVSLLQLGGMAYIRGHKNGIDKASFDLVKGSVKPFFSPKQ